MTNPKPASKSALQKHEDTAKSSDNETSQVFVSQPQVLDESQEFMAQVLGELDYVRHKEKRVDANEAEQFAQRSTLQSSVPKPKLSSQGEKLLGILGHCSLPGHIAHFYNMQAEIERHIKSVSELGHERFVAAYNYLKANPSTEAVFVYETKMVAANRVNGRLIQKNIIAA